MTDHPPDPDQVPTPSETEPAGAGPAAHPPGSRASSQPAAPEAAHPAPEEAASSATPASQGPGPDMERLPSAEIAGPTAPWNPLPERALPVYVAGELPFAVLCMFLVGFPLLAATFLLTSSIASALVAALCGAPVGLIWGLWLSVRRFRRTFWRLDAHGLSLREGRLWQHEVRVPATRVQHLDLQRGPLQRRRRLATLEIHTAGSRHGAVTLQDLDEDDAERLRDALGRQVDRDLDD